MVIDLVIVTAPKPPGSRTLISPPGAVFEIAPAKVLHGAVRLHGFTSSPTPETQVRVACAWASEYGVAARIRQRDTFDTRRRMSAPWVLVVDVRNRAGANASPGPEFGCSNAHANPADSGIR